MSRAAVSKSRADKGKPPAAQTPVITHEIVPGKFNDNDWNTMLERESSEEFVLDIVDEIISCTMDAIYNRYIQKQLLPFTISQAKDAILQIIEWQFLTRDEGEAHTTTDPGWLQDEEPDPAVTDCWAQGSVPRIYLPPPTPVLPELPEPDTDELEAEKREEEAETKVEEEEPELADKVSEVGEEVQEEKTVEKQPEVTEEKTKKKRFKFKPYRGTIKSAGVSRMTESLEETEIKMYMEEIAASVPSEDRSSGLLNMPASCHSILRIESDVLSEVQAGRPPGNKDVLYDEMGNVVAVLKLDPEKLPNHRVRVKYQVVDPSIEAAQARLEAMRHGRYIASRQPQILKAKSKKSLSSDSSGGKTARSQNKTQQAIITPLPPPLIEAMEVSPGVIVKEGGRVKKGPGRYIRKVDILEEHQSGLRPIASRVPVPPVEVADLLDRHTPLLRPIQESPPLPPIVPHPPTQPRVSS